MKRTEIYKAIDTEREYQDKMWINPIDRPIDSYATYIAYQVTELQKLCATTDEPEEKMNIIRKIAALCVSCAEKHGISERETPNSELEYAINWTGNLFSKKPYEKVYTIIHRILTYTQVLDLGLNHLESEADKRNLSY